MNNKHMVAALALVAAAATSESVLAQYETDGVTVKAIEELSRAYENKDFDQVKKIKDLIVKQREARASLAKTQMGELDSVVKSVRSEGGAIKK